MGIFAKWKRLRKLKGYDVDEALYRIQVAQSKVEPGTPEFDRLAKQWEQALKNKKLVKEMRFMGFKPDTIIVACLILAIAGFGFALDLESPRAIKIAQLAINVAKKMVSV